MTGTEIMIDGTQCRYAHFDGGNTQRLLCSIDDCFCDCYREQECYYKQLKRKEQECERLKGKYLNLKEQNGSYIVQLNTVNEQLDRLKAENAILKQYKASKQASYESMQREWNDAVNGNRELKAMQNDLTFENKKFCYQIEELTNKLKNKKIEYKMLELLNKQLEHQLKPFKDKYFKGLDNVTIAELAKKSIRITAENCKLEQTLTEIKEIADYDYKELMNATDYHNMTERLQQILQKSANVRC